MRHRRAHIVQNAQEAVLAVAAPHRAQHRVGAGLQGHVQARHHIVGLGHRLDHVVGERRRMRAGEPDAFQTVDLPDRAQQLREGGTVTELDAVGVDVLAEQGDLLDPLVDQHRDLAQDLARPAVGLLAAQAGDDTEGAGVVAADADRHPGGIGRVAAGRQVGREGLQGFLDLDLRLLGDSGAFQQHRQRTDVVGAKDHVHPGRLRGDEIAVLLSHAATDGDLHARAFTLDARHVPEVSVETVVGVLSHGAGVEDDHIGVGEFARGLGCGNQTGLFE
ncbi:hypothetical protein SDC9_130314 [bioreactor metagenome]|uniref:Uncharacterized protein n=1 Tax=bioreactor metagenome TaxID=1076179 RepID=A0A645D259_9ZZZZ